MSKLYPQNWPNRHLLPFEQDRIGLEIVEAIDGYCDTVNGYSLFQATGTFKQTTKAQVRPYVIRWLIRLSNSLQVPVWCWCGKNIPSIQPKSHFHSIMLIPKRISIHVVDKAWKLGIMNTEEYNPNQTPYNFIEYMVGKHDIIPIQNPIRPSLKQVKNRLKIGKPAFHTT